MFKILSILIIYLASFFIFFTSASPVQAACSFTIETPQPINPNSQITVKVTPTILTLNARHTALITTTDGSAVLQYVEKDLTFPGNDTITINAPNEAGVEYLIGVYRGTIEPPPPNILENCGNQNFTTGTNFSTCEGFFGCLSGINNPDRLNFTNPATFIEELISSILPIVLGIIAFITVIIIIISGIQFITSSGNPEAAAAARSRLTLAIVGFVIVVLAFAITQIIDKIFLGGSGVF